MARKGDVIRSLIELNTWRKQLRYAAKAKRYDLALQAIDNCFALTAKAIQATITPRRRGSRTTSYDLFFGWCMIRACASCGGTGRDLPRCPQLGMRFCSVECHEAIHARRSARPFGW